MSPILPEHWARFQFYASRIQFLEYGTSSDRDNAFPHVFESLAKVKGDGPLLPNLQRIVWKPYRTIGPELMVLMTPTLKDANICPFRYIGSIDCPDGKQVEGVGTLELASILDSLSSSALALEHLTIEGSLTSSSTSSITRFRHLRTLDLGSCGAWSSSDTFHGLASLERLAELKINTDKLNVNSTGSTSSFRSLQSLHISGTPPSIRSVFCIISSTQLRSIVIGGNYSYYPDEWRPCFHTLQSRYHNSLTHFRMNLVLGCLSMTRESENIMEIIRPLLDVSILQVVVLNLEGHLRVDDADIASMAHAWQNLRHLHLWCHKSGNGPSLESLTSCAAMCPHLHQLELPIDASKPSSTSDDRMKRDMTQDPSEPSPGVVSNAMRSIEFLGNVGITDPDWVASRIRSLFPQLRYFEAHSWDPSMAKMWDQVRRLIPARRKVRQRQRQRIY